MALRAVPTMPPPDEPTVDVAREEGELAEALVALRRVSRSSLLPGHAQGVLSASVSLLEMFAPPPVLRALESADAEPKGVSA